PPHYHIAVFPKQYAAYVERKLEAGEAEPRLASTAEERRIAEYRVRRGDSLWSIAERHGTSISDLRAANDLRSSRIYAGQVLTMPAGK
ncbi:MAG: LysM peptidoglycan-binding domain-containing protein, partial [marine benthic group bacterium]|nr:LysM peptidoglycan-binding domain-containing protein [Gemmatimonadota bacterium]